MIAKILVTNSLEGDTASWWWRRPPSVVSVTDGPLCAVLRWLRDEARLIEMDYHIKLNLIIDEQNHDKCLEVFKELAVVSRAPGC